METQPITFRIPAELYEWLRREAFDTRESMNAIVTTALEELRARRQSGSTVRHHVHGPDDECNPACPGWV